MVLFFDRLYKGIFFVSVGFGYSVWYLVGRKEWLVECDLKCKVRDEKVVMFIYKRVSLELDCVMDEEFVV